jgi:SHS2 domain-containing protein
MYEVFEHTADVGLRIKAATLEELFRDAARGLLSLLVGNVSAVQPVVQRSIDVAGEDRALLLRDWLDELLYTFEADGLILAEYDLQIDENGLHADCRGEPIDRQRHQPEHEVKAVTYHGLKVQQTAEGWLGEVILDI